MRHDDSWTLARFGELISDKNKIQAMFGRSEPRHEPADVTACFAVSNEPVIVQLLAGHDHGRLW